MNSTAALSVGKDVLCSICDSIGVGRVGCPKRTQIGEVSVEYVEEMDATMIAFEKDL